MCGKEQPLVDWADSIERQHLNTIAVGGAVEGGTENRLMTQESPGEKSIVLLCAYYTSSGCVKRGVYIELVHGVT